MSSEEDVVNSDIAPEDSVSQTSSRASSTARRAEIAAKTAALKARMAMAQELRLLEIRETEIRQRRKELEIEEQLSALLAEEAALTLTPQGKPSHVEKPAGSDVTIDNEVVLGAALMNPALEQVPPLEAQERVENSSEQSVCTLDPLAVPFAPNSKHAEDLSQNHGENVIALLHDSLALSRLPAPEPSVFTGNPLQYYQWKLSFQALIDNKRLSSEEKMFYLQRYLGGSALKAVEGFFYSMSADSYRGIWKVLDERYGHKFRVQEAFREKLRLWPTIGNKDGKGLQQYADFLKACLDATSQIPGLSVLSDCNENQQLVTKLPESVSSRWNRKVTEVMDRTQSYPSFADFVSFMSTEARIACNPVTSGEALRSASTASRESGHQKSKNRDKGTALSTSVDHDRNDHSSNSHRTSSEGKSCYFCHKLSHCLPECRTFQRLPYSERNSFVQKGKICFSCLRLGHRSRECRRKLVCEKCQKQHPTALHEERGQTVADQQTTPSVSAPELEAKATTTTEAFSYKTSGGDSKTTMIVPVWLSAAEHPTREVLTYAILDNQSDVTFVTEAIASRVTDQLTPVRLHIRTVTSPRAVMEPSNIALNLNVRGMFSTKRVSIQKSYTRECIPCEISQIPTGGMATRWPHLKDLESEIPKLQDCEVGLLIGTNCPTAGLPRQTIIGKDDEPYAVKTDLGWSIVNGGVETGQTRICHKIKTKEGPEFLPHDILTVLQSDFHDTQDVNISQEDLQFLDIMESGITTEDGHIKMPLPFRSGPPCLPNNLKTAQVRLSHLKKRLQKDATYHQQYTTFMQDVIAKGEVEVVTSSGDPGRVWYIPHHGVYHPRKPDKLRVVFDCSATHQSASLNANLLAGPDLLNHLIGILCRFRQHPVAFICDIERMFHQFLVNEEHRDYLRFLWWEGGKLNMDPIEYRMKVHLFGASSSPGCANFAMKHLARQNMEEYQKAASFILKNFYVDDGLQSCGDSFEAISLIKESQKLCQTAKLHLHKFISNDKTVLQSIESSELGADLNGNMNLSLPSQTVLGLHWHVEDDSLTFIARQIDQPNTRRGILSAVASIYDPLGFISPLVLEGKSILQEMCKSGTKWDDPLPEHLTSRWLEWKKNCTELHEIQIQRCVRPGDIGEVFRTELHHFSDASNYGYGQCSYLRLVGKNGMHCTLLCSKARIAPVKIITIPRLELTAALTSASMSQMLKKELDISIDDEYFWTDSKVVLAYINNDARKFHLFVANRVQKIHQLTEASQWYYVNTHHNPADIASRGTSVSGLLKSNWFRGPDFLWDRGWKPEHGKMKDPSLDAEDPEIKKVNVLQTTTSTSSRSLTERLEVLSKWSTIIKVLALLRRVARCAHGGSRLSPCEERLGAETFLIKLLQSEAFEAEIESLQKGQQVRSNSQLHRLKPFIDEELIVRVGGRLSNSDEMLSLQKHPAVLSKCQLTGLLVRDYHQKVQHQGRGITLNELRASGYWILGGAKVVQNFIFNCVTCRRLRRPVEEQQMADLPKDRLTPSSPFSYCGMDVFGPFLVKRGRSEIKRYGLLVTCLLCRGVHIELLEDMSTDCFLNALRCFIALRGTVRQLRCDQGSNFVGAKSELENAVKQLDVQRIQTYLADKQCDFLFNPPSASHAGGIWERQIRTIRSILDAILLEYSAKLDDASLRTFMLEAMAIVNSRPLTVTSLNDPTAIEPLTPNHILQMKSTRALPPPGRFEPTDLYIRKRWRRVQYLTEVFWGRWKREYLLSLNERQKWTKPRRNLLVGDVVMVKDESTPRMEWPLAIITEAQPDADGLVRKVKISVGTKDLGGHTRLLERPVQKLVLLLESSESH